jgi:hypothetical protein
MGLSEYGNIFHLDIEKTKVNLKLTKKNITLGSVIYIVSNTTQSAYMSGNVKLWTVGTLLTGIYLKLRAFVWQ